MRGLRRPPDKATGLKLSPPSQGPGLGQVLNAGDCWLWLPIQKPQPTAVPMSVLSAAREGKASWIQEPRPIGVCMPLRALRCLQSLGKVVQVGNLPAKEQCDSVTNVKDLDPSLIPWCRPQTGLLFVCGNHTYQRLPANWTRPAHHTSLCHSSNTYCPW